MALSIDIVKILILVCLLISTFLFGILPVVFIRYIEKSSSSQSQSCLEEEQRKKLYAKYWKILSFLNCFAAGVFLATCLLELLPSVRENLMKVMFSENIYTGFPMAEFVMIIGLLFILIIEQIALSVKENSPSHSVPGRNSESDDVRQPLLSGSRNEMEDSTHSEHFLGGIMDQPRIRGNSGRNSFANGDVENVPSQHTTNTQVVTSYSHSQEHTRWSSHSHSHSSIAVISGEEMPPPNEQNIHVHSLFRSMFLLCALSLHAVFEGLTLGLQNETSDLLSIFGALVVHKSILSFSLGMNIMQSKISVKSAIKSVMLFSISSPVGMVVGILIMDLWDSTKSGVIHGLLQGFASGTFLYIIFFEILPKEFNSNKDRLLKVLFLIIGYGVITGLLFLGNDIKHPLCLIDGGKDNHP